MNAGLWLALSALCFALGTGVAHAAEPAEQTPNQEVAEARPLDLNQATLTQLEQLPGIGQKRAQAILDFRATHNGFSNVSQLLQIKGIGRAMLRKLRPLVTIGVYAKEGSPAAHAVR